jgi:hypothetical protein
VLTETLAWYSALEVVERTHGRGHLERLLGMMRQAYLTPRARADVPLLRADDWFLAYRKGPLAMYALREYAGAEPVRQALQRLFVTHGSGQPPLPTPRDLYRELQAAIPTPLHGLLADLFETNTFWELAAERAGVEQTGPSEWRVSLDVRARKVSVDTDGVETVAPMDDLVELGVFANADREGRDTPPLYLRQHRIRNGVQRITVTVTEKPARAGIDPRRLLIDTDGDDNVKPLKAVLSSQ